MGFVFFVSVFALMTLLSAPVCAEQKEAAARGKGCLGCHEGIEVINERMAEEWRADSRCEVCHYGVPAANTEFEAHAGLISNPGDLRVIERTCGKCHSDYGEVANYKVNGIDNHVGRVIRSIMATAAGEIAGTRYLWNVQNTRSAIYGVRAVTDWDYRRLEGAVERLLTLPLASNSNADNLLRSVCLRCHLWTEDKSTPGIYRPAGCSACHVLYEEDGLSQSGDPTIPKDERGHPVYHRITTEIPTSQCLWCHNDGGARIGFSYVGLAVTDPKIRHEPPEPNSAATSRGVPVMHVKSDVHFRRGLSCIDCHDTIDVHGDGRIYSHKEYQVGIECESCHGNASTPPSFRTARGDRLTNIEVVEGKHFLRTKVLKELHRIPTLNAKDQWDWLPAIWHQGHTKLECYACHSNVVPQCYACHMERDDRAAGGVDWVASANNQTPEPAALGKWSGRKLLQLWLEPTLGVNRKGRVAPFVPGGQAIFTHRGPKGELLTRNQTFTTAAGLYGFSLNPIQPHNIDGRSRTCSSCHSQEKAVGLGTSGFVDLKRLGLSLTFSPDMFVNEEGSRVQDSPHEGARPFTWKELQTVYRTGTCIDCHRDAPAPRHDEADGPVPSFREADKFHHETIGVLLQQEKE